MNAGRRGSSLGIILLLLAASVPAATYSVAGFSDTAVVSGLDQPTDFTFLPDGRILILEKPGRVKIAPTGGGAAVVAIDMTSSVDDGFEKGLLGVTLHPSFATNGFLYLYYTTTQPRNQISRFTLVGNTIALASELPDPAEHRGHERQPQRRDRPRRPGRQALGGAGRLRNQPECDPAQGADPRRGQPEPVQREDPPDGARRLPRGRQPVSGRCFQGAADLGVRFPQPLPVRLSPLQRRDLPGRRRAELARGDRRRGRGR